MKNTFKTLALCAALAAAAGACKKNNDNNGDTTVTVVVAVTSVTLNKTTATLTVGDTLTLTAAVAPDNADNTAVAWASSNPAVATVTDGLVTAVAAGTADITVTTQDGNQTATCAVTVNPVAVASVTLNQTTADLTVGETLTLTATVAPDNADNKNVAWASSNSAVATVANVSGTGLITAVAAGTADITVTTQDGNKIATCVVTVEAAGWNTTNFGVASFATTQTWTVGTQTWSDAVQTTVCSGKTTYDGGTSGNFKADCRSNPEQKGDLFSWLAVSNDKTELCPAPWRVPTRQDFIDLDIAMGGTGNTQTNTTHRDKYLNTWGGSYEGYCTSNGTLTNQSSSAYYWSQSESSADYSYRLSFGLSSGSIYPQSTANKNSGFTLRCVKDVQ
jgi:uncharacterized protein (TIGR02145 family)